MSNDENIAIQIKNSLMEFIKNEINVNMNYMVKFSLNIGNNHTDDSFSIPSELSEKEDVSSSNISDEDEIILNNKKQSN